jgi:bacterial/archaeal transporter family-2 protein
MKFLFYILPIVAGVAMSIQSGINAQLRSAIQYPLLAALISFLGGTLALVVLLFFSKQPMPGMSVYSGIEWYKFIGGFLGAFIVYVALISVQEIGAANMFVLIVAGQLLTAVLMDHFGILGMKQNPISIQKLLGILLVIAGAWLVNKK